MALTRRTMFDLGPGGESLPDYGAQERQQQRALEAQILGMALEQSRYMFQASFNQRNKAWEQAMKEKAYEASRKDVEAEAAFKQEQLALAQQQSSQAEAFRQEQRQWQQEQRRYNQTNKEAQDAINLQKLLQGDGGQKIPLPETLRKYAPHLEEGSLQDPRFVSTLQSIATKEELAELERKGRADEKKKERQEKSRALRITEQKTPGPFAEELKKFRDTYPQAWTSEEKEALKHKLKLYLMDFPDDAPVVEAEFNKALQANPPSTGSLEGEQVPWGLEAKDLLYATPAMPFVGAYDIGSSIAETALGAPSGLVGSAWETTKQFFRSDEDRLAKDKERRDAMREAIKELLEEASKSIPKENQE